LEKLFQYNWQVRNDWFSWCEAVPEEELLKNRVGGVGGILETLFHIIVVEYSWICDLEVKPDLEDTFEEHASLDKVTALSKRLHPTVSDFIAGWNDSKEAQVLTLTHPRRGELHTFRYGEVLRHMIAHEIHHMGQLSVWARELGREPVTANLIFRGLFD
jgi:uncharacterized damage-inducible protein DinB